MKQSYIKDELLSAYIDGELSDSEIKNLEKELQFSKELQNRVAELKRLKQLTVSSIERISENPYFETRLAANMRTNKSFFSGIKRFAPVAGIVALTITLMVVLKFNPQIFDNIVEQQKNNITDFYKENLRPILYATDLSNQDIFDFAFNRRLPLDEQKKQYLQLGSEPNGNHYLEIKTAGLASANNTLNKFIKGLNLNQRQISEVDSILQSYAPDLQSQVLVNANNTVAVNSNIWNYNKAIMADLLAFASKANKQAFNKVVPSGDKIYDGRTLEQMAHEVKSSNNNNYIFVTPDTIFSESFKFDKEKFKNEMKKMREDMKKNFSEAEKQLKTKGFAINFDSGWVKIKKDSSWDKNFKVYFDTNACIVHLSKLNIPQIPLPNFDDISRQIEEATKNLRSFTFDIAPAPGKKNSYNFKYRTGDSTGSFNFNLKAFSLDSLGNLDRAKLDSLVHGKLKNFKFHPDSMASMFRFFMNDSTMLNQQHQFQMQMKQLQREMERFRKQMEKMQKQMQKNSPGNKEQKSSSSVEI